MIEATAEWFATTVAVPADQRTLIVDGYSVSYQRWGVPGGPLVVLVHGGAAHAHWWDHIAPALVAGGRTVVALDLTGHGDSAHRPRYDMASWSDEVLAVAQAESRVDDRPVVVGHSLGGIVAWTAARRHGRHFAAVVVVDAAVDGRADEHGERPAPRPHRRHETPESLRARFRLLPPQDGLLTYVVDHIAAHSMRHDGLGWTWKHDPAVLVSGFRADLGPATFDCPIAFLYGEYGMVRASELERSRAAVLGPPMVQLRIDRAGHHVMLDRPAELLTTLNRALYLLGKGS